ncbi:cadmium-translocating P-type ATPase [Rossellomorea aquimaris]|uniref:heavy metal translocating P-type ATPase n=1 Tax=Rossellomorea aquimaris TaxID=189382 RepID=UPI001CD715A6|nr:heavy metal translocating P-type ATPase [Rossellomorea aquimaris]MCA1059680.1 cadmium-translocating P-type ATPase [Rossellomorea aquimaris]
MTSKAALKQTYRVEGFTCAGCAAKFEKNVQHLDGVIDAKVNFGAAKITVYGDTTKESVEKAGAFEGLRLTEDGMRKVQEEKEPFYRRYKHLLVSVFFILIAYSLPLMGVENSHFLSTLSFATAIVTGGYRLFEAGFKNLLKLEFDMRTLMTIAIIGAAFIGEWGEGAIVVLLFAISEVLEAYSMDKARESIRSLMDIAPPQALIIRNGFEMIVDAEDIEVGDIMLVKPGQKIAMDGDILEGSSFVNQAAITGESVPVEKVRGDAVFAGTLNEEGHLKVLVTKRIEDTTLAKIIHLVEEAQGEKAPSQAFVDVFAKYYTPVIMVIAFLVAIIPPLLFGAGWSDWVYQGLSVLVVGCPCALVISTPVAIVTAIGNAAKNGILIKGGVYLEELGRLKAVAFDKTGTLTKGVPEVTDMIRLGDVEEMDLWKMMAALEFHSQHPLAHAFMKKAEDMEMDYRSCEVFEFQSHTGKGISGLIGDKRYYIGSQSLFAHTPSTEIENLQREGKTVMVFGTADTPLAIVAVADEVRDTSGEVINDLHQMGMEQTVMLTGDHEKTARSIGTRIGVREIKAGLLPEEKLGFVKDYMDTYGRVAMIGDGINDAPALAASTVGIAMGGAGTDTALETADIALMNDDLRKLPYIIRLSRSTLTIIKQNIAFAIGIKLLALLLVIPGMLTLWIAIFADMGATLLVTLNGLRLLRIKDRK